MTTICTTGALSCLARLNAMERKLTDKEKSLDKPKTTHEGRE